MQITFDTQVKIALARGFDVHFDQRCYKMIGSCFKLNSIELRCTWELWRALKKIEFLSAIPLNNSHASFMLSKLLCGS